MLTNFDPNLKISDENFKVAILSTLNTILAIVQILHAQMIELEYKVNPSILPSELAQKYASNLDTLFDEAIAEVMSRYGE